MRLFRNPLRCLAALSLAIACAAPVPTLARPASRLVSCSAGNCLLVTGRRTDSAAPVTINGHAVAVAGGRSWSAMVPMEQLREWAEPFDRAVTVAVGGTEREVSLPIGLLGRTEKLAFITVRVK